MFTMIIKEKAWIHEEGSDDARIVLLAINKGLIGNRECIDATEFSTHMQIANGEQKPYFAYGHYYNTIEQALQDFYKREV